MKRDLHTSMLLWEFHELSQMFATRWFRGKKLESLGSCGPGYGTLRTEVAGVNRILFGVFTATVEIV